MSRTLLFFTVLALMPALYAGTVTFTGTCTQHTNAYGILLFNLSNSGNDTAYTLQVTPHVGGATSSLPAYYVSQIGPGKSATLNITFGNITADGSYADYLTVTYLQDSSMFTVIFPCVLTFNHSSTSNAQLYASISYSNSSRIVNVSVLNTNNYTINDDLSLLLPPGFAYTSNNSAALAIEPHAYAKVLFTVNGPSSSSASGAVASQYFIGNVSYSSIDPIVLAPLPTAPPPTSALPSLLPDLAAGAVVVLLCLILRAYLIGRRRAKTATESS